ncbi:MAG: cytochrome c [Gammaproteobacteria bacterium]|nr:cytochrome c [Gammaproteobacteria bacterium]
MRQKLISIISRVFSGIGLIIITFLGPLNLAIGQDLQDAIIAGKAEFKRSCAVCHGDNGKGDGVFAAELKLKPTNLTVLKKQNNGVFPTRAVYRAVDGTKDIKSHGLRTMPLWGDRFDHESVLFVDSRFTKTFVRGRIFELILYLEEIQNQ